MRLILSFLIMLLSACGTNIDSAMDVQAMTSSYSEHQKSYNQLAKMILEDSKGRQKFEVGDDRIGDYRLYDKGWAKLYGNYVTLDIVLSESAITDKRHSDYIALLNRLGASVVAQYEQHVSITISATGLAIGGCLTQLLHKPSEFSLEKPPWAQVFHKADLGKSWYGITKCN